MAETIYDVGIRYNVDSRNARNAFQGIGKEATKAAKATGDLSRTIGTAAKGLLAWGGFRVGKSLLIDYNSQMEQAGVRMAGLLRMNMGGDWADNQKRANTLMGQFQQDAKSSVATTADFVDMASQITGPLSQAGASMADIRDMTKGAVVAAGAFGISGEMAALDIQQALSGTLSNKDRFAKMLGLDPKSWNEMVVKNPAKAIPELMKIFNQPALKEMAAAQANTFAGQWSTLKDNLQITLGKIGLPLMKAMAAEFGNISTWMDKNPDKVAAVAAEISNALITGFKAVKSALEFMWDHRELIFTLAKALLAFKVVKGAVGMVGGGVSSILSAFTGIGSASGTAQKGMTDFAGKLPGIAAGLGIFAAAAQTVADKLFDNAVADMKVKEDNSFINPRLRGLGGGSGMDFATRARQERIAKARGYTSDAGAKLYNDDTWGRNKMRQGQLAQGIYTAGDKLAAHSALSELNNKAGRGGGLSGSSKISMKEVMNTEGFRALPRLLEIAQGAGFQGNYDTIANMSPKAFATLVGPEAMASLASSIDAGAEGDRFVSSLQGVIRALDINAQAIADLDLINAVNDTAYSTIEAGAKALDIAGGFIDSIFGEQPGKNKNVNGSRNTNVTINKIEVVADDPDRFAMNLVGAFQDYNKSPTQALRSINER